MVQWLRLCPSTARDTGSIPGQGTKIPHAAWCEKERKKERKKIKKKKKRNTLEVNNSRLGDTEECITDLEYRIMEITQSGKQKEQLKIRTVSGTFRTTSSILTFTL